MERLAPHLPLVVAWIGVEADIDTSVAHLLDDGAGVLDAGILLATTEEEYIELFVEVLHIAQHSRHFGLEVEVGCA